VREKFLLLTGSILLIVLLYVAMLSHIQQPIGVEYVAVTANDTLWAIARRAEPEMDPRVVIADMRELNPGLDAGKLRIGQRIAVPRYREPAAIPADSLAIAEGGGE